MAIQGTAFSVFDDPDDPTAQIITTGEKFERLMRFIDSRVTMVFDYETSGLAYYRDAESIGAGIGAWDDNGVLWKAYVPYRHKTGEQQLDFNLVAPAIKRQLGREDLMKICHNFGFEEHMSRRDGWVMRGPRFDTLIAGRLFDENEDAKLEKRAMFDLGRKDAFKDSKRMTLIVAKLAKANRMGIGEYKDKFGYSEIPIRPCGFYCCTDIDHTGNLAAEYERRGLRTFYPELWKTETQLIGVLTDLEEVGMRIDVPYLEEVRESQRRQKEDIADRIKDALHGWTFNWASDAELRDFLLNKLGCQWKKLTKGGKSIMRKAGYPKDFDTTPYLAVDSEVLGSFATQHPVVQWILDWRECDKIESTYTTSILKRLDRNDYVHGSIKQCGTNTGRMSAHEPNYHNLPSGPLVRSAFIVVGPRWVRLFLDYSQVELRVLAFYSQDQLMLDTYINGANGGDIHETTRAEVSLMAGREFERRGAKVINFGLSYGLTAQGLAHQAKLSDEDAVFFMDAFERRFAGVGSFREALWTKAIVQGGTINNIYGRSRRLPEILPHNPKWMQESARRRMVGSIIQGTAADIMKRSLVRVDEYLKHTGTGARICNTVHDDIQIDCPYECSPEIIRNVKAIMEDVPELSNFPGYHAVPITADCEISATDWGHKVTVEDHGGVMVALVENESGESVPVTLDEWYVSQLPEVQRRAI